MVAVNRALNVNRTFKPSGKRRAFFLLHVQSCLRVIRTDSDVAPFRRTPRWGFDDQVAFAIGKENGCARGCANADVAFKASSESRAFLLHM